MRTSLGFAGEGMRLRDMLASPHNLGRDVFMISCARLLQLALNGLPGCLHSLRSLRDIELQRFDGDQDAASSHAEIDTVAVDDPDVVAACLAGIGMPLALALPLWQRLRRVGLLCELLGRDSTNISGRLLCALGGAATATEPLEAAALHSLWFTLCHREILEHAAVDTLVEALVAVDGAVAALVIRRMFEEGRTTVSAEEWQALASSSGIHELFPTYPLLIRTPPCVHPPLAASERVSSPASPPHVHEHTR